MNFMYNVMVNGIGGTHLGGENSVSYQSSVGSLVLDVRIYDFLTSNKAMKDRAIADRYLQPTYTLDKAEQEIALQNLATHKHELAVQRDNFANFKKLMLKKYSVLKAVVPNFNKTEDEMLKKMNQNQRGIFRMYTKDIATTVSQTPKLTKVAEVLTYKVTEEGKRVYKDYYNRHGVLKYISKGIIK